MGVLQLWLDEPDESIARFARVFYVLSFVFLAAFAVQLAFLMMRRTDPLQVGDVAGPLVSLLLTATMLNLALDGRRSYKAMKGRARMEEPGRG